MTVRTRFSPSPTGYIHLGNARAALFSALFALKNQGVFILRIEDTDATRSDEQYVEDLQQDLKWLGVIWQEGPGAPGQVGPYWQSQRQDIYAKFYQQLEEKKIIYPCFCSDQTLAMARKLQISRSQAPRYSGVCKPLSSAEIADKLAQGLKPAWRFGVPANESIVFVDLVKGPQHFESNDIGDFIVRRADGTAPFLFCNAVDDAAMKVTHVLRGEDHLANTPRQILVLKALGLTMPAYGHLSLIVGEDGAPLSKRHGSFSLSGMRQDGFLPQAIMNYLARLGHGCDAAGLLDKDQLAEHFHITKLSRSSARFDMTQLMYWQKMAVLALDASALWRWLGEKVQTQVAESKQNLFIETVKANMAFPADGLMWANIFSHDGVEIDAVNYPIIKEAGEQFFVEAEQAVDQSGLDLKAVLADMTQSLGVRGKKLFMPLRVALTGKTFGPELAQVIELLGVQKVKHRLSKAFKIVAQ